MRAAALFAAAALVSGCASPPVSEPGGGQTADANDCAVIAAIAKEHYRFDDAGNPSPPLWLDGEGSGWAPRCDWSRYGVSLPRIHDPARTREPGDRVQWVSFKRPRYDDQGAIVETGVLHGPLNGMGYECRVRSGFAGWAVSECRNTWIS